MSGREGVSGSSDTGDSVRDRRRLGVDELMGTLGIVSDSEVICVDDKRVDLKRQNTEKTCYPRLQKHVSLNFNSVSIVAPSVSNFIFAISYCYTWTIYSDMVS